MPNTMSYIYIYTSDLYAFIGVYSLCLYGDTNRRYFWLFLYYLQLDVDCTEPNLAVHNSIRVKKWVYLKYFEQLPLPLRLQQVILVCVLYRSHFISILKMDIIYSSEIFVPEVRRLPSYPCNNMVNVYTTYTLSTQRLYVFLMILLISSSFFYLNFINRLVFL